MRTALPSSRAAEQLARVVHAQVPGRTEHLCGAHADDAIAGFQSGFCRAAVRRDAGDAHARLRIRRKQHADHGAAADAAFDDANPGVVITAELPREFGDAFCRAVEIAACIGELRLEGGVALGGRVDARDGFRLRRGLRHGEAAGEGQRDRRAEQGGSAEHVHAVLVAWVVLPAWMRRHGNPSHQSTRTSAPS